MNRLALYAVLTLLTIVSASHAFAFSNNINLRWVDEDTNAILNPAVIINGDSVTVSNGISDYNTNSATASVNASLTGYLTKNMIFGFPGDANILYTVTMVIDTNSLLIPFRQRTESSEEEITDFNILVTDQITGNVVDSSVNEGSSTFNSELSPQKNTYLFQVTGSGITDFNYTKQNLSIRPVIDERFLTVPGGIGTVTVTNPGVQLITLNDFLPDQNLIYDPFTGADGDPPDPATWTQIQINTAQDVNILDNNLSIVAVDNTGNRAILGVKSDENYMLAVGEGLEMECLSASRPVNTNPSHGFSCGLYTPPITNPQNMVARYRIFRNGNGVLNAASKSTSQTIGNDQTDGPLAMKLRLMRIAADTYRVQYLVNDTNLLLTEEITDTNSSFKFLMFVNTLDMVGNKTDENVSYASLKTMAPSTQIFPFTDSFYSVGVDYNSSYYPRTYRLRLLSAASYALQPYVVSTADGVSVVIKTIQSSDIVTPVPDILIRTEKDIDGTVEVESIITDDKGEALQSYIVGDDYTLKFYDTTENLLFTKTISATSSTIYVFMSTESLTFIHTGQQGVTVAFNPLGGRIFSTTNLTQTINVQNTTINRIELVVTNADVNVFDMNYTSGVTNGYQNTISASVLGGDVNLSYEMSVYVFLEDGNVLLTKTTYTFPPPIDPLALIGINTKSDIGCDPNGYCPFLALVSVFISLIVVAGMAISKPDSGAFLYGLSFMITLGIFTIFLWFPGELYAPLWVVFIGVALYRR